MISNIGIRMDATLRYIRRAWQKQWNTGDRLVREHSGHLHTVGDRGSCSYKIDVRAWIPPTTASMASRQKSTSHATLEQRLLTYAGSYRRRAIRPWTLAKSRITSRSWLM